MIERLKWLADGLAHPLYLLRGRPPWALGYTTAKRRAICAGIDAGQPRSGPLPTGYGFRIDERAVEYPWLFARLPQGGQLMLDAGSALNHEFLLRRQPLAGKRLVVATLAPEKRCYWRRGVGYLYEDLRRSCLGDGRFDIVASMSTIEHIGLDNTMLYTADAQKRESDRGGWEQAVAEYRRILRPGGTCFLSFPYGRAANHGWFQVFDAGMVARLLSVFAPAEAEVDYFAYRPDGWQRCAAEQVADATFFDIHAQRRYDPDRAAGARGLACLRLVR